jgi:hypothetical protein
VFFAIIVRFISNIPKIGIKVNFSERNNRDYFNGIGLGLAKHLPVVFDGEIFDASYYIEENDFNSQVKLQLRLKDFKPHRD